MILFLCSVNLFFPHILLQLLDEGACVQSKVSNGSARSVVFAFACVFTNRMCRSTLNFLLT